MRLVRVGMPDPVILQMPAFRRAYQKLPAAQRAVVDHAVRDISANPKLGEVKKGDLAGVCVYKFPLNRQEMLLAYEWDPRTRLLLLLGSHENFYRDLKRA